MKIETFIALVVACFSFINAETFSEAVFKKDNFDLTKKEPQELFALNNFLYYLFLGQNITNPGPSPFEILDTYDVGVDLALVYAHSYALNFLIENGYDLLSPIDMRALYNAIDGLKCEKEDFENYNKNGSITCGSSAVSVKEFVPLLKLLLDPVKVVGFVIKNGDGSTALRLNQYIQNDYLSGIKNPLCKLHMGLWFQAVQNPGLGSLWAAQMFDAFGKPPKGLFNGNINWAGSYEQCTKINVDIKSPKTNIKGKYCRTNLDVKLSQFDTGLPLNENIGFEVGLCAPKTCSNEDVQSVLLKTFDLMTLKKNFNQKTVKVECDYEQPYSTAYYVYTVLLCILAAFCGFATIVDIFTRINEAAHVSASLPTHAVIELKERVTGLDVVDPKKQGPKKKEQSAFVKLLVNCSLYKNAERILSTSNPGEFTCLNGLRALSMVWIVGGHTFNYLADISYFLLVQNALEIAELVEKPIAQLIINAMYGVDTFFVIGAFLITYGCFKKFSTSKHKFFFTAGEWVYFYFHRYWRLIPPYLIVFVIYIYILPWYGSGPFWYNKKFPMKNQDCHDYWWSYILLVNNFVPNGRGTKCMGYLWYVSNDYQLYLLTPIFLILLYKFPIFGASVLISLIIGSTAIFGVLSKDVYIDVKKDSLAFLMAVWDDVYTKPYCRAAPWIIGIFLGAIMFKYRKVTLHWAVVALGWLASTGFALSAIFASYTNYGKNADGTSLRKMGYDEFAIYFSVTRITWSLSIAWIIFACHYGYGGIINRILSANFFIPITKISYCAYLIHPVIMVSYMFSQKEVFFASYWTLMYLFIGHLFMTIVIAFIFSLIFEQPFVALEQFVKKPSASKPKKSENHQKEVTVKF